MRYRMGKNAALAIVTTTFLFAAGCDRISEAAKPTRASCPPEAVETIRAAMPAGWKLSVESDKALLRPLQPIKMIYMVSYPAYTKPEDCVVPDEYLITLRFGSLVSPEEYQRLAAQNAATCKQMKALYEEMRKADIILKGEFRPVTPEQHKLVEEYKKLDASLHELPDACGKDFSVWIFDSRTSWLEFLRAEDGKMCSDVMNKARALFTPYPRLKN